MGYVAKLSYLKDNTKLSYLKIILPTNKHKTNIMYHPNSKRKKTPEELNPDEIRKKCRVDSGISRRSRKANYKPIHAKCFRSLIYVFLLCLKV